MNKRAATKLFMVISLVLVIAVMGACAAPEATATPVPTAVIEATATEAATMEPTTVPAEDTGEATVLATPEVDVTVVDEEGNTQVDAEQLDEALTFTTASELTEEEIAGLLFMREEEKLARDVYLTLYDQWGLALFSNIADSEATHMDSVLTLIERYGLDDPAVDQPVGSFINSDLQQLYDELVAAGSTSLGDALKVGAAIEEIDILDLQERVAQTDNADIRLVYDNLTKGSRNHLRSFTSTLERQTGEVYEPGYLSVEDYEAIVSSGIESGRP